MSWQIGDLAICVDDRYHPPFRSDIRVKVGCVYRVTRVYPPQYNKFFGVEVYGLELREVPCDAPRGWASVRFQKIEPDKHEDCEPEFIELLNRIKRKVSA